MDLHRGVDRALADVGVAQVARVHPRAAARRAGVASFFPPGVGAELLDDHTPFLRAGIPSIDLIDFTYVHADTSEDTVDKLDPEALDAVGEATAELLIELSSPV